MLKLIVVLALLGMIVGGGARARAQQAESAFTPIWIGQHRDAPNWTIYTRDAIQDYGPQLMNGSTDMANFCPKYDRLSTSDKENFWIQLIASMTKYESGFRPETRFVESGLGTDPVTGKQVVSEGLLQLSYQDEPHYRGKVPAGVCDFDYARDQRLPTNDLRRSILDPKNNLTCGVSILNFQVKRRGAIAVGNGAYWSVIKVGSRYNKLTQIKRITKSLSFCS